MPKRELKLPVRTSSHRTPKVKLKSDIKNGKRVFFSILRFDIRVEGVR